MFDDVQPPKSGNTPPNLPIGEPEDIFESSDPGSSESASLEQSAPVPQPPVFSNTALDAGILKPKSDTSSADVPLPPSRPSIEPTVPRPTPESAQPYTMRTPSAPFLAEERGVMENQLGAPQEAPFSGRKILMVIIILVILIVIGFGSLWIYTSFIKKNTSDNNFIPTTDTSSDNTPFDSVDTTLDPVVTIPTSTNPEDSILFGEPVDTDSDGILDVDEAEFGTNTLNFDTDGDELSDGDEVMVWHTNPQVFDTDGDTYSDGVEVRNGYNPAGPGKLFETSTTTTTTTITSP